MQSLRHLFAPVLLCPVLHYWHVIGANRCKRALAAILADEGRRASGDHTYHAESNLAAFDDQGKPVVLRASLYSVLGQGVVLGLKVSIADKSKKNQHTHACMHVTWCCCM